MELVRYGKMIVNVVGKKVKERGVPVIFYVKKVTKDEQGWWLHMDNTKPYSIYGKCENMQYTVLAENCQLFLNTWDQYFIVFTYYDKHNDEILSKFTTSANLLDLGTELQRSIEFIDDTYYPQFHVLYAFRLNDAITHPDNVYTVNPDYENIKSTKNDDVVFTCPNRG